MSSNYYLSHTAIQRQYIVTTHFVKLLMLDYDLSVTNGLGSIMFQFVTKKPDCEIDTKSSQNLSK